MGKLNLQQENALKYIEHAVRRGLHPRIATETKEQHSRKNSLLVQKEPSNHQVSVFGF